jgi:pimeloyl-ACP methyl ester carboxylesterase
MKKGLRIALIILGILLVILLVGPFLVPIPALEDTLPPRELADEDSQFIEVNGIDVHYKTAGEGEPTMLLLHGFAASLYSWREVMEPLGELGTVVAFDRPAFGLTERPMPGEWEGESPYGTSAQADLTVALMDALGIEEAVLVGNSAGGTVSVLTALRYPERVTALVLVDAAVYSGGGSPRWILPLMRTPQVRRIGPLFMRSIREWGIDFGRSAWHDPSLITDEIWEGYTRPLYAENWDRALFELAVAGGSPDVAARFDELTIPVLVITGDDDRIVPTEDSIRLAGELDAELAVIENCGHIPHEECPEPFLEAVVELLNEISE